MRIWSLHPKYLDAKGLVALWRETLLARHVLEGKTKGYINHPQLNRFKTLENPVQAVHQYLAAVYKEALSRGYGFDISKFDLPNTLQQLTVTKGQVNYEAQHLLNKLQTRDPKRFETLHKLITFQTHPMFTIVAGGVADWEVISFSKK